MCLLGQTYPQNLKLDFLTKQEAGLLLAFGYHPTNLYTWTCFSIYCKAVVDVSHIQQFFTEAILKPVLYPNAKRIKQLILTFVS